MIGIDVQIVERFTRVKAAADRAAFRNLGHAAASISKTAKASIERSDEPSDPGQPPHSRRAQLPRAIRFDVDKGKQEAVIGPRASIVGESGAAHELGEVFHGQDFDERPFMLPALEDNLDRFASDWAGSIGE
ncbi:MAG: hypothetical protein L0211_24410 [Planctomycetaceae bacterium]|nr:hypothetical protein [Planctomycetaceae bacterium]